MSRNLEVAIGIATAGRRDQLGLTLQQIARQSIPPKRVLVCPAALGDFDESQARSIGVPVQAVSGQRGLCAQRNAILSACDSEELLIFFDDDFYPAYDYVKQAIELMSESPRVVVATHHPRLDGAAGRGVSHEEALRAIEVFARTPLPAHRLRQTYAGYGCNMILRLEPVRQHGLRFDENLPFYAWLEDVEFSRRLSKYGSIVESNRLRGVHLGTKGGRSSGVRLGYSQVANPLYMLRKGSLSMPYAVRQVGRNVLKNTLMALWPEPWVDRPGRFKGNIIAFGHLLTGRLHPLYVKELE